MRPEMLGGLPRRVGLNLVYLLLAFPLGLFYFIVLVTGLSLGLGLAVILWGIPLLLGVAVAWWWFAKAERSLTIRLLGARIGPMRRRSLAGLSRWEQLKAHFANRVTWTSLIYLLVVLPFGTLAFCLVTTFLSVALWAISLPVHYRWSSPDLINDADPFWTVNTWWEAALLSAAGALLLGVTLVLILVLARAWRAIAELLLGYPDDQLRQGLRKEAFLKTPALPERASPPKVGDALSRMI